MAQTTEGHPLEGIGSDFPSLTWDQVDAYLDDLRERGRTPETIKIYRSNLQLLFEALPENGRLDHKTLARWRNAMLDQGYTPRTVNVQLASANGFFDYLGLRDYQLPVQLKPAKDDMQPELTRDEYLRLLSAARALDK